MASPEMLKLLQELRKKVVIGFVGGSDLTKISEQLSADGIDGAYGFKNLVLPITITMPRSSAKV